MTRNPDGNQRIGGFSAVFETSFGWAGVYCTSAGVRWVMLPLGSRGEAERAFSERVREPSGGVPHLPGDAKDAVFDPERLAMEAKEALISYFEGQPVQLTVPLDLGDKTAFERSVLTYLAQVEWGNVITYGELASRANHRNASRAVGVALSRNRTPILVPCHRVIRKDGGLGGFREGVEWKKRLLQLEGHELGCMRGMPEKIRLTTPGLSL